MGNLFSSKKPHSIICCGLDHAGKSTIINALKPQKKRRDDIGPTPGYQMEEFEKGPISFKVFDMGGAKKHRDLWEKVFNQVTGVIFVIDSSDRLRMVAVQEELEALLGSPHLRSAPLLVFANKMDLPGGQTPAEIVDRLQLASLCRGRPYQIHASNALTGEGISDGVDWLGAALAKASS
eukprot:TRINITY_DN70258_c0_g1_i1.p1 TRINITY_DN70258_c0_g1~~TRINITY_DN70258_c0_g1_i1.p1  ORF type:complete len:179 (+),score=22.55 TRINITY_DN70258_c0_g1_i1:138-674(+)